MADIDPGASMEDVDAYASASTTNVLEEAFKADIICTQLGLANRGPNDSVCIVLDVVTCYNYALTYRRAYAYAFSNVSHNV